MNDNPRYRIDTAPLKELDTVDKVLRTSGLRIERMSIATRHALVLARDHLIDAIERGDLDEDCPVARGRKIREMTDAQIPNETWGLVMDAYWLDALDEIIPTRPNFTARDALRRGLVSVWTRFFASLIDHAIENGKGKEL